MQKTLGYILSVAGLIGVIIFTYQYVQDSDSFSIAGADVAVSTGDWVPILISGIIMIVGVVISRGK